MNMCYFIYFTLFSRDHFASLAFQFPFMIACKRSLGAKSAPIMLPKIVKSTYFVIGYFGKKYSVN